MWRPARFNQHAYTQVDTSDEEPSIRDDFWAAAPIGPHESPDCVYESELPPHLDLGVLSSYFVQHAAKLIEPPPPSVEPPKEETQEEMARRIMALIETEDQMKSTKIDELLKLKRQFENEQSRFTRRMKSHKKTKCVDKPSTSATLPDVRKAYAAVTVTSISTDEDDPNVRVVSIPNDSSSKTVVNSGDTAIFPTERMAKMRVGDIVHSSFEPLLEQETIAKIPTSLHRFEDHVSGYAVRAHICSRIESTYCSTF
jgi:ASC-1-like (ASCH) protein